MTNRMALFVCAAFSAFALVASTNGVPFMTQHRNMSPSVSVTTNFYGSVTGVVDKAYVEGLGISGGGCDTNAVSAIITNHVASGYLCTVGTAGTLVTNATDALRDDVANKQDRLSAGTGISMNGGRVAVIQGVFSLTGLSTVGSPTVSQQGVLSGISKTAFVHTAAPFDPQQSPWEILTAVDTPASFSGSQSVLGCKESNHDPVALRVEAGKWMMELSKTASASIGVRSGTHGVQTGTRYWLRVAFDGSAYTMGYRTSEHAAWTEDIRIASTNAVYGSYPLAIGIECTGSAGNISYPWQGSIDLAATRVTVGGATFWDGASNLVQGAAVATDTLYGLVKPDGVTTTVSNGVLSAVSQGGVSASVVTGIVAAATNALPMPTSVWSDANARSAACTNRADSFGNLYKGTTRTGGVWTLGGNTYDYVYLQYGAYKWYYYPRPGYTCDVCYYPENGLVWSNGGTAGYAAAGLNPLNGDDIVITNVVDQSRAGTFTPQDSPTFSPTPYDRFARASELTAAVASAAITNAGAVAAATAMRDDISYKMSWRRDIMDLDVYENEWYDFHYYQDVTNIVYIRYGGQGRWSSKFWHKKRGLDSAYAHGDESATNLVFKDGGSNVFRVKRRVQWIEDDGLATRRMVETMAKVNYQPWDEEAEYAVGQGVTREVVEDGVTNVYVHICLAATGPGAFETNHWANLGTQPLQTIAAETTALKATKQDGLFSEATVPLVMAAAGGGPRLAAAGAATVTNAVSSRVLTAVTASATDTELATARAMWTLFAALSNRIDQLEATVNAANADLEDALGGND